MGGKNLNNMLTFAGVYYDGSTTAMTTSEVGNRVCYAVDVNRNSTYKFDVYYNLVGNTKVEEVVAALVSVVDKNGVSEANSNSIVEDAFVTAAPAPAGAVSTLSTDALYAVTVNFNLKEGYWNPDPVVLSDAFGNKATLTVKEGNVAGYAYRVEFVVKGLQGLTLTVNAQSNENLTYTVTLDTDANINIVSGGKSQVYKVGSDTAVVFTVTTVDNTYTIAADTLPVGVTMKNDTSLVNGKWVTIWTITAKDLAGDTTISLKSVKKSTNA